MQAHELEDNSLADLSLGAALSDSPELLCRTASGEEGKSRPQDAVIEGNL